jgi:uncharacterized cupin superfamily protein
VISHWDEVRSWRAERGHIAGTWQSLTGRASQTIGLKRIQVDPGMWSTPLRLEGAEEEIFFVLGGSGTSVQWEGEDAPLGYEVHGGDCLVHLALENAHTLRAGEDGLDVLASGQRIHAAGVSEVLPGKLSAPPHCHSAEEEIFVVLDGEGELLLWEPDGVAAHPVRAGSVVARRAGTGVAHAFRAGEQGMSVLMYGSRDPADSATTRAPARSSSRACVSADASSSSTTGSGRSDGEERGLPWEALKEFRSGTGR